MTPSTVLMWTLAVSPARSPRSLRLPVSGSARLLLISPPPHITQPGIAGSQRRPQVGDGGQGLADGVASKLGLWHGLSQGRRRGQGLRFGLGHYLALRATRRDSHQAGAQPGSRGPLGSQHRGPP